MQSVDLASSRNSLCGYLTPAPAWPILLSELLPLLLLLPMLLPPLSGALSAHPWDRGTASVQLEALQGSPVVALGWCVLKAPAQSRLKVYSAKSFAFFLPVRF